MIAALLLLLVLPAVSFTQADKSPDVWKPLNVFVGSWEGTGKGQPGNSKIEREYQYVLNGRFLQSRNKSIYPPQKENPKGEVHEDWGLFSYDRNRAQFVLRQFHVEGFVTHYASDREPSDGTTLRFVSESIENIGAGWRARETYRIVNANEFTETFELAAPGKEFEVYTESHFKRKK
ncbi:MAG: hypothetical protein WAU45_06220 [Blastocatellia bacterium]